MMDFTGTDLYLKTIMSQRTRDAESTYRVSEFTKPPRGLRASLALRLAHLAVHLDGEVTGRLVGTHMRSAGHHS
jgi:hypothetical protein